MTDRTSRFLTLDSLRGLAATAVAIYHFSGGWSGYLAVDFFLVLSGFILSHSYLYGGRRYTAIDFISHRLARLYPLHFFTLFTFLLAVFLVIRGIPSYPDGTLFTFIQNLTLTHNIGLNPSGMTYNYPSWSISVEFWVNVIFIFLISRTTKSAILFFVSLLGLVVIYRNTGHLDTHAGNYYGFLNSGMVRGVSCFFLGIISYRIYLRIGHGERVKKYINYLETLSVVAVSVVMFVPSGEHSSMDMLAPLVFMFVVTVFSFETGFLSKHLRKIRYLGEVSYSIYLNQITVLLTITYFLSKLGTPKWLGLLIYLSVLFVYSHFTFKYIEKPLRSKGRNILSGFFNGQTKKNQAS